jgi:hypothetical protein
MTRKKPEFIRSLLLSAALLALLPACLPGLGGNGGNGSNGAGLNGGNGANGGNGENGGDGCAPENWGAIESDFTLTEDCSPYAPGTSIEVNGDATLTIEAGVEVRFASGDWLRVGGSSGGKLVANGTTEKPVVLTADEAEPTPGSWIGVVLSDGILSGTILDNVEIHFAGDTYASYTRGCLSIDTDKSDRITVQNSSFNHCLQSGVSSARSNFSFAAFSGNTFSGQDEAGLWIKASSVGSLGGAQTYDGIIHNLVDGDTVAESATWPTQDVPWRVNGDIVVEGTAAPVLTLSAGNVLQFEDGNWLRVGSGESGSLVAAGEADNNVVFESRNTEPVAGDWIGLVFSNLTLAGTSLDHVTIRHGGDDYASYTRGCLSIDTANTGRISVTNSTFEGCAQSGVAAVSAGFEFETFATNTFVDSDSGMWLHPSALGSVDNDHGHMNTPEHRIANGTVEKTATWKAQGLPWHALGSITVESADGPVLTVEGGTIIEFDADEWLRVGSGSAGGLVMAGTSSDPIFLQSAETQPTPGSWIGVVLSSNTLAGTSFDHVTISHAGDTYASYTLGCLNLDATPAGRVSVTNSEFSNCMQSGVSGRNAASDFAAFDNNTFTSCDAGMWLNARALGTVGGNNTYASTLHNIIDGDTIEANATWAAQSVPWRVDDSIVVDGTANPVLTISAGSRLQFSTDTWLRVGNSDGGGLVLAGNSTSMVILESDKGGAAAAGDWIGVVLDTNTLAGTSLDYASITHAGDTYASYTKGGLSVLANAASVTINNSNFAFNNQADLYLACAAQDPSMLGNTFGSSVQIDRQASCP